VARRMLVATTSFVYAAKDGGQVHVYEGDAYPATHEAVKGREELFAAAPVRQGAGE
jgi:hypothetical protein